MECSGVAVYHGAFVSPWIHLGALSTALHEIHFLIIVVSERHSNQEKGRSWHLHSLVRWRYNACDVHVATRIRADFGKNSVNNAIASIAQLVRASAS